MQSIKKIFYITLFILFIYACEEDIYYDIQPFAINLSAIYKEYIAGLSFNGNKYTFSAGYHAFNTILFNINYAKSIYNYVDFFKISLIYHH
jgi:hypothetical protein